MKLFCLFTPLFMLLNILSLSGQIDPLTGIDATNQTTSSQQPLTLSGLASPILLQPESTEIALSDYFMHPESIDFFEAPQGADVTWTADRRGLRIAVRSEIAPLSVIGLVGGGERHDILLRRSRKVRHTVKLPDPTAQYYEVQFAGDFNNWNPKETPLMQLQQGVWQADLFLEPGIYPYKVVANGNWLLDPFNPDSVNNNMGGYNSVMRVGEATSGNLPRLYSKSIRPDAIVVGHEGDGVQVLAFWQNQWLKNTNTLRGETLIPIPSEAQIQDRTWLRVYAYNRAGVGNDLLIPLDHGVPVLQSSALSPADKEATILYFLMIDRFNNGNRSNDNAVQDARVLPAANYKGGDLRGVTNKIKEGYFEQLGINSLWLSPIVKNPLAAYQEYAEPRRWFSGYHGYWPVSNTEIDTRFGTSDDLYSLSRSAHDNRMTVLLDLVANHFHEEHPIYKQHPDWATPLNLPDGRKNIRLWDEQRLTTWFDIFLPTLDFEKPEVVNYMVESSLFWLQEYGIDGFRHDATKHIPNVFWQTLTNRIKSDVILPQRRSVLQLGETYGSRELIGSYVGSGQMDGQFDFNLYFDARSVFALDNEPFGKLQQSLSESLQYYGHHSLMGNISGNHDMARFISYASGALRFDENAKEAGWSRQIKVENPVGYKKLEMLLAFTATIPGVPVLYYGDEIGMAGGDDPDNRRMMRFEQLSPGEADVKEKTAKLFKLRRSKMALLYGDLFFLQGDAQTWSYMRTYFDKTAIVVFNKSGETKDLRIKLPSHAQLIGTRCNFKTLWSIADGQLHIVLPPYSFEVLTN